MTAFYDFEVALIARLFEDPGHDKSILLSETGGAYLDAKTNQLYVSWEALQRRISDGQRPRSRLFERTAEELLNRGALDVVLRIQIHGSTKSVKVRVLIINASEVPPTSDWPAIREIDTVTEHTVGVRVHYYTRDPAAIKLERLKRKHGVDKDGRPNIEAAIGHDKRWIPTEEDYKNIRTTKVLIMDRALTYELAPSPERAITEELWKNGKPDFNAYASTLVSTAIEAGESVIYPIYNGIPLGHQQTALRAALRRAHPTASMSVERYGNRYFRLRLR